MVACTVGSEWEAGSGFCSEQDGRQGVGMLGTGLGGERGKRKQPRKQEIDVNNHGLGRKGRDGIEWGMTGMMIVGW